MKSFGLGTFALALLMATPALADDAIVARCSNGEEIQLTVRQVGENSYAASVITQSVGDSYPEFHFKNLKKEPVPAHTMGAPAIFTGKGFDLYIQLDALKAPADLTIPSIGIHHEKLSCR